MAKQEIIPPGIDESSPAAFREWRPKTWAAIIRARAEGCGIQRIAKEVGVGVSLIYEIIEDGKEVIEDEKAQLARNWSKIAHKATTLLYENIDEADAKTLAVVAGIATEKKLLLEGEPGQIVEHRVQLASVPLSSVLETTTDTPVIEAEVIEGDFSGPEASKAS
jgi:hypothetical protein